MEVHAFMLASSPNHCRGSLSWVILIVILIVTLAVGWLVWQQIQKDTPMEQASVAHHKVPPPPPSPLMPAGNEAEALQDESDSELHLAPTEPAAKTEDEVRAMPAAAVGDSAPAASAAAGEEGAAVSVPQPAETSTPPSLSADETDGAAVDELSDNGAVTTTSAAPAPQAIAEPTVAASAPVSETAGVSIQVGAFLSRPNALLRQDALHRKGYSVHIHDSIDDRQRTWYAVRIGPFASRAEAARVLDRVKGEESADAILVQSR